MRKQQIMRRQLEAQVVSLLTPPKGRRMHGGSTVGWQIDHQTAGSCRGHGSVGRACMSAPTEQQVAGRTSDTVNTSKNKKVKRKNCKFKRNQVKIFFAGLPPRTPVRTHTPVSRYGPSAPRGAGAPPGRAPRRTRVTSNAERSVRSCPREAT